MPKTGKKSGNGKPLTISVFSFGYKFGLPRQADFVFDVRFLPNPYYDGKLQPLSGKDKRVQAYVLRQPQTRKFLSLIYPFLNYTIPEFAKKGKKQLTLAVGCTGGRHRSIVIANEIFQFLSGKHYRANVKHRDIRR